MPESTGTTVNIQAPAPSGGGATIAAGASTGAAVGAAFGPIGAGIGAAAGAVLGALTLYKGKTAKLNYEQAVPIVDAVAPPIITAIESALPTATDKKNYGIDLANLIIQKLTANAGQVSNGWQAYRTTIINDLTAEIASAPDILRRAIIKYVLYVAVNYDANRPDDFKDTLVRDLVPMFQALISKYPATMNVVNGQTVQQSVQSAPVPAGSSGGGSSSPAAPAAPAPAAVQSSAGMFGMDQGKLVLIAGFAVLIIGVLLFTRKR